MLKIYIKKLRKKNFSRKKLYFVKKNLFLLIITTIAKSNRYKVLFQWINCSENYRAILIKKRALRFNQTFSFLSKKKVESASSCTLSSETRTMSCFRLGSYEGSRGTISRHHSNHYFATATPISFRNLACRKKIHATRPSRRESCPKLCKRNIARLYHSLMLTLC